MGTYAFSGQAKFVTIGINGLYDFQAFGAAGGVSRLTARVAGWGRKREAPSG